ncbi:MAG: FAD-binding protein [Rhizobiaceae bacterium]
MDIQSPSSEEEAADVVRDAHDIARPLEIRGGGTRLGFGGIIDTDRVLSSRNLGGIVDYEPAEMVLIAKAGTPMSEIDSALHLGKQRLIFEPVDHRRLFNVNGVPTIGGIVAGNVSGPRRFVAGACRDSLLGVRFINGLGEVVKTGGRVMKNVTGLDLVKPMAGSWGTLGFLTEVTFKVVPQVETEATLVIHSLNAAQAARAMSAAMATSTDVCGAAYVPAAAMRSLGGADDDVTLLRLEGFESSVSIRARKLKNTLSAFGEITTLDAETSHTVWIAVRDCLPFADETEEPIWRISMAPMDGHKFVDAFGEGDYFFDWQGGLIWLRLQGDPRAARVRKLVAENGGGHATLVRASQRMRRDEPVFNPEAAPIAALSGRIRSKFDPKGIFNPGRMS